MNEPAGRGSRNRSSQTVGADSERRRGDARTNGGRTGNQRDTGALGVALGYGNTALQSGTKRPLPVLRLNSVLQLGQVRQRHVLYERSPKPSLAGSGLRSGRAARVALRRARWESWT